MTSYPGRHRAPNQRPRLRYWAEFGWAFIRNGTQIFAITILLDSLAPLPHI